MQLYNAYCSFTQHIVEIDPATKPIVRAIPVLATTPDGAPIATPPARLAFRISSIENLSRRKALKMNAARQLPVKAIIVLLIMRDFEKPSAAKYPALKEGQNIHKNSVPIIAKVELMELLSAFLVTITFFPSIKLTVRPKYAPKVCIGMDPPASKQYRTLQTISSLSVQPTSPTELMTSNQNGPTLPSRPPKAISIAATEQDAAVKDFYSRQIVVYCQPEWNTRCQKDWRRGYNCMFIAFMRKVYDRALQVYPFTNVIRNPKPINIITFTSWNIGYARFFQGSLWGSTRTNIPYRITIATSRKARQNMNFVLFHLCAFSLYIILINFINKV